MTEAESTEEPRSAASIFFATKTAPGSNRGARTQRPYERVLDPPSSQARDRCNNTFLEPLMKCSGVAFPSPTTAASHAASACS